MTRAVNGCWVAIAPAATPTQQAVSRASSRRTKEMIPSTRATNPRTAGSRRSPDATRRAQWQGRPGPSGGNPNVRRPSQNTQPLSPAPRGRLRLGRDPPGKQPEGQREDSDGEPSPAELPPSASGDPVRAGAALAQPAAARSRPERGRYAPPPWSGARCQTSPRCSRTCASASGRSTNGSRPSGGIFDLAGLEKRAAELSEQAAAPDLWNDPSGRRPSPGRTRACRRPSPAGAGSAEEWTRRRCTSSWPRKAMPRRSRSCGERSTSSREPRPLELQQLLGGEHDAGNTIVEIHPGPEVSRPRTGPRCSFACTCAGPSDATSRPSCSSSSRERAPASRARRSASRDRTPTATRRPSRASTVWSASHPSTPTPVGRRRSPPCSCSPTSRRTSRSSTATRTCASIPTGRAAPAAST